MRCSSRPNYESPSVRKSDTRLEMPDGTGNGATTQINGKTSQASTRTRTRTATGATKEPILDRGGRGAGLLAAGSGQARGGGGGSGVCRAQSARRPSRGARLRRPAGDPRGATCAHGDRVGAGGADLAMGSADPRFWALWQGLSARACTGRGVGVASGLWTANWGSWSRAIGDLSSWVRT